MAFSIQHDSQGKFAAQGELTRNTATLTWQDWQQHEDVQLDLSAVTQIDTAGLAWLVNLLAQCKQQQCKIVFTGAPERLMKLAKISDVDRLLPLQ